MKKPIEPERCVFCQATPKVAPADPKTEDDAWGLVACVNPKCTVNPQVGDGRKTARSGVDYRLVAIRRWNGAMWIANRARWIAKTTSGYAHEAKNA